MISGILRDKRQRTSHNSLSTKDVSAYLLTSLTPEKVIEGNEGLVDTVVNAIKSVIQKIIDGFKWLWNALFGSSGDVKGFTKGLKELKGAKLKSHGLTFNKKILYFVKREHWGDPAGALKDLIDVSESLAKMAVTIKEVIGEFNRVPIAEGFVADGRQSLKTKIDKEYVFGPRFKIKCLYDPQNKNSSKDNVTLEKTEVTREEAEKNDAFFYISREAFEAMVKNLISIGETVKSAEKDFTNATKKWEDELKNFSFRDAKEGENEKFHELERESVSESVRFLTTKFTLIKTLWINFSKEIEEFKSLTQGFVEK